MKRCLKIVMCGQSWSDEILRNALGELEWVWFARNEPLKVGDLVMLPIEGRRGVSV